MQKDIPRGLALLAVGVGSALAVVSTGGKGPEAFTVAGSLLSGACTALGVTSVLIGWAGRRPAENTER